MYIPAEFIRKMSITKVPLFNILLNVLVIIVRKFFSWKIQRGMSEKRLTRFFFFYKLRKKKYDYITQSETVELPFSCKQNMWALYKILPFNTQYKIWRVLSAYIYPCFYTINERICYICPLTTLPATASNCLKLKEKKMQRSRGQKGEI